MDDLINRQSALDALDKHFESFIKRFGYDSYERADEKTKLVCDGLSEAEDVIIGLPSATDKNVGTKLGTNLAEVGTDCISRQTAIDIIEDFPHGAVWNVDSMEEMVDRIKQLPPIQPEPKRGKWIDKGVYTYVDDHRHLYKCDQCGNGWLDTPDFCPNCGAKMEVTT